MEHVLVRPELCRLLFSGHRHHGRRIVRDRRPEPYHVHERRRGGDAGMDVRRAARPTHARRGAPPPPRRPTLPHRGLRRRSRAPRRTYAARPRRLLHSQGRSFLPVSYTVAPLRSSGEIVGLVVVCRDASERRQAEHAIRADEADARLLQALGAELTAQDDAASLYRKIVDGASQLMRSEFASMQMLHPERGTSGELQLLAFRGFAEAEAKRWEWLSTDGDTTCSAALKTRARVIAADTENSEFRTAYHDTAIRAVQSTPLFSRSGALVGIISTHWDHPNDPSQRDLRNLDILARQAADLIDQQRARTRKDEFLATLAHELRNPLGPIRNALSVLNAAGVESRRAAQAREIIGRQVDQMVRLIDDLMDVNRISRGTLELRPRSFELASLVWHAVETCVPNGGKRDVTVSLPPQPVFLNADPVRLYQILCNILHNASKFTAENDRIAVTAQVEGGELVLTITSRF